MSWRPQVHAYTYLYTVSRDAIRKAIHAVLLLVTKSNGVPPRLPSSSLAQQHLRILVLALSCLCPALEQPARAARVSGRGLDKYTLYVEKAGLQSHGGQYKTPHPSARAFRTTCSLLSLEAVSLRLRTRAPLL